MPSFFSDPSAILWDATAVSNAFLCEYMPVAPDLYVKVYLYGLMYAHGSPQEGDALLEDVAKALETDRSEVEKALRYWEKCRLVERVKDNPPSYRFACVQQAILMKQNAPGDRQYEEFARALNDIFGNKRQLHGGETVLAYEWVEDMKLPPDVVLMLIRHMISTRGVQFRFKEAEKVATELCDQNARTQEAVEAVFSRSEAAWRGARKILNRFGKHRNPSEDEIDLYLKWTKDWGFAPKAVEAACSETTKGDPSFKYLDGILNGLYTRSGGKATTAAQVEKQLGAEKGEGDNVRTMLAAFGARAAVVDDNTRALYREMRAVADEDVVLLAAREVGKTKGEKHTLDNVTNMLLAWKEKGLTDTDSVNAYLKTVQATDKRLRALFVLSGQDDARCTQNNRELLRKWRDEWHTSDPLLDLAASYAKNAERSMQYMDKLLSGWREKGVSTVAEAEAEHMRFAEAAGKERASAKGGTGVKRVIEQQYEQREYAEDEWSGMSAEDIEEAKRL